MQLDAFDEFHWQPVNSKQAQEQKNFSCATFCFSYSILNYLRLKAHTQQYQ